MSEEIVRNLLTVARNPANDPTQRAAAHTALRNNWMAHEDVARYFESLAEKEKLRVLRERIAGLKQRIK